MKQFGAAMEARYKNIILDGFDPVAAAGFTQVPNVILKSTDLSVGAKLMYALLLSYAWQKDSCFPGQETLASDMGVSKRSVVTFIKELDRSGFFERQTPRPRQGQHLYPARQGEAETLTASHTEVKNLHFQGCIPLRFNPVQ